MVPLPFVARINVEHAPQHTLTDELDGEFEEHNPRLPLILKEERYSLGATDAVVSVENTVLRVNLNDEVLIVTGLSGNFRERFELELPQWKRPPYKEELFRHTIWIRILFFVEQ